MKHRVSSLALLLACAACGASQGSSASLRVQVRPEVTVLAQVRVSQGAEPERDALDLADARLQRALERLAARVGHAVDFEFDVGTLPRPRRAFFEGVLRTLGALPEDLERLPARRPELFAWGAPALRRVRFEYEGRHEGTSARFSRELGLLSLRMGTGAWPVPTDAFTYAFEEARDASLVALFDTLPEDAVAPAQLEGYVRYLTRLRSRLEARAPQQAEASRVDTLARALRLAPRVRGQSALEAPLRRWLVGQVEHFHTLYQRGEAPRAPAWLEAERLYAEWLYTALPSLDARELAQVGRNVPVARFNVPAGQDRFAREALPGFDVLALGTEQLDRWIAAGHRAPVNEDDNTGLRVGTLGCSGGENEDGRSFPHCSASSGFEWLAYVLGDERDRPRLVAYLRGRGDTRAAAVLADNAPSFDAARWLWRALEVDEALWRAVTVEVLYAHAFGQREALLGELERLWRDQPSRRDLVLYGLLFLDQRTLSNGRPATPWRDFARSLGSPLDGATLARTLELFEGVALDWVDLAVPALPPSVSVAELVLPRLDRFPPPRNEHRRLSALVEALRSERREADLAALRPWLERRAQAHPSEDRWLQALLARTRR